MTRVSDRQVMSVVAVIAIATGLAAWTLATPHIIGHDDGIYLSTAKAIAEGKSYRLINLPHGLWQTKYPPLYSILLASTFAFAPPMPGGIWMLKILNAILLAGLVVATVALARRLTPQSTAQPSSSPRWSAPRLVLSRSWTCLEASSCSPCSRCFSR